MLTAVDLLPTFMEFAGVDLPDNFEPDGQSAVSAFKGEGFKRTKPVFWEWRGGISRDYTWPTLGIRDGRWKLLVNKEQQKTELYDLENDWAEMEDVLSGYPEVVQDLSGKLNTWKDSLPTAPRKACLSGARKKK
ncbi:MAG: hypothetical protein GY903_05435 [Fuerstiella sp.]|nr:hypothetical protein [Fuerstiella sp.]MCP4853916.1 hypothetical protein [Fuerstiella sp.]